MRYKKINTLIFQQFILFVFNVIASNFTNYSPYSSQNYRFVDVDKWDNEDDDADSSSYSSNSVFIVSRLRKFTKYEIVIQAVNQYGEGPLSRPSVGQTKEDGKFINKCSQMLTTR